MHDGAAASGRRMTAEAAHPRLARLAGGDRRALGQADAVAATVLARRPRFAELWTGLDHADPVVRMRAADALEKVTARRPDWRAGYAADLLRRLAGSAAPAVRWHLIQMTPRLALDPDDRAAAVALLEGHLGDASRIVVVSAMQALFDLAGDDPARAADLRRRYAHLAATGSPAVRSRAHKLLAQLPETPS